MVQHVKLIPAKLWAREKGLAIKNTCASASEKQLMEAGLERTEYDVFGVEAY
jgi:hypothetical protein